FVIGDNRRASKDSRSFGAISGDAILGNARFVYYPLTHMRFI
ncbi:MAG: S26 family signal peptidase, partial [Enterococcus gallinarum]|nr:S26 family signal peptidase [Enterococcus gallinarum]